MAKRIAISLLLSLTLPFLCAGAESNPFDIDDECYACYSEAIMFFYAK